MSKAQLVQALSQGNIPAAIDALGFLTDEELNTMTVNASGQQFSLFGFACVMNNPNKADLALAIANRMTPELNNFTYVTGGRSAYSYGASVGDVRVVKAINAKIGLTGLTEPDKGIGHFPVFWPVFALDEATLKYMTEELKADINISYRVDGALPGKTYKDMLARRQEDPLEIERVKLINKYGGKTAVELATGVDEGIVEKLAAAAGDAAGAEEVAKFGQLCRQKKFADAKILAAKINPYQTDKAGFTPAMHALELGDESAKTVIQALFANHGGNLNSSDIFSMHLSSWAAMYNNVPVLKFLNSKGVSLSTSSGPGINNFLVKGAYYNIPEGLPLIHLAAHVGAKSAVKYLLEQGHGKDLTSEPGGLQRTADAFAKIDEIRTMIQDAIGGGADAAAGGAGARGAVASPVNAKDAAGVTPFVKACRSSDDARAKNIAKDASFNPLIKVQACGPVTHAVLADINTDEKQEVIESLLAAKADLNGQDLKGLTATMHALSTGRETLAEWLIGQKADPMTQDFSGHNLTWYASNASADGVVALLASLSIEE